jgi:hypothetical protein
VIPLILDQISQIVRHDLDPEFIKTISISMGWEYAECFEALARDDSLTDTLKNEEFSKRRSALAIRALVKAAKVHRVPYNFRRLACNGQEKLLVKAGRVVVIQEPIIALNDRPHAADYKVELASTHSLVRQLELEFGDQPKRIYDWSGCVLAALLHAPAGPNFTKSDRTLGALMLAVPDAAYCSWTLRLDLHRVAMFGFAPDFETDRQEGPIQEDRVIITPKKRNAATGTEG